MKKTTQAAVLALLFVGPLFSQAVSLAAPPTFAPSNYSVGYSITSGTPIRAGAFIDSVGVATKMDRCGDIQNSQSAIVIALLAAAQIHHVRMGLQPSSANCTGTGQVNIFTMHGSMAANSIGAILVTPNPEAGYTSAQLVAQGQLYADLEGLEGPNEYDRTTPANGNTWYANLAPYLATVRSAAQTLGVLTVGPSFTTGGAYALIGNTSSSVDVGNLHDYLSRPFENGGYGGCATSSASQGYGSVACNVANARVSAPSKPVIQTEGGYNTVAGFGTAQIVPESVAAAYLPRMFMFNFLNGITRNYSFQIADSVEGTFGLLRADLTAKPAYIAVKNMMSFMVDRSSAAQTFTPTALSYTLSGSTSGLLSQVFQKADGSYVFVVWNPASIFNQDTGAALSVPAQTVTLAIAGGKSVQSVYTLDGTGAASNAMVSGTSVTFPVTTALSFAQIK